MNVSGRDDVKAVGVSQLGELRSRDGDPLRAGRVIALADELEQLLAEAEPLVQLDDPVVHLAEEVVRAFSARLLREPLLLGDMTALRFPCPLPVCRT